MTRSRINAGELARLFNAARQPIYVLDEDLTIVFLNRACHEWLGSAADGLLGRRCAYHSQAEAAGGDAVAAGLCPPPTVSCATAVSAVPSACDPSRLTQPWHTPGATGVSSVTATVCFQPSDGAMVYRRARFILLETAPGDLIGLVAIVDAEDLTEPPTEEISPPAEAASQELHEQIRRFRWQAAGRYRVDRLLGHSPALRRARRQIELAVGSRSSVLLVGPPGSGRQHAAATIHYASDAESAGSLVPLACSVLGAELIGSTIAALATAQPLGEGAGRSTLILSDVDQLAPDVQAELAAVLTGRPFPLRLIATAAQPLDELVRRGRFRDDLAAVLSTIVIELPPLAERRGDIPLLAQALLEEINAQGTKQIGGLSAEALDRLDAYPWPGNVDELARVMAEAHQRAGGPEIGPSDLPERLHLAAAAAAHPRRKDETIVLDEFLGRMERELIRRALARAKGNKAKAARLLGLTRPRLYRRMVQLGLAKE